MKLRIISTAIVVILLNSCAPSKVAIITSENVPLKAKGYEFENESVRINYRFWGYKGKMEFDIYNKTDVPLYFDWKTSAYIPNDKMISYYEDVTNTEGVFYSGKTGVSAGKTVAKHQERIAVVPPHSLITNNQYSLVKKYSDIEKSGVFDKNNTPLRFRNYLTMCTNEKFDGKVSTIDNNFFISTIKKVSTNKIGKYKVPTNFYATFTYSEY